MEEPSRTREGAGPSGTPPHIVGVGASAGGLKALETLVGAIPAGADMALVIVQHLDPTHDDLLVEILSRHAELPVSYVDDGTRVEAGHVYVVPAGKEADLRDGHLHLAPRPDHHGLKLPIDAFLRSLAGVAAERAIAVILSGTGSDGTVGCRAVKEAGGAVFVQEPGSADFDGMPRSVIDAGLADHVDTVDQLPGRIAALIQHDDRRPSPGEEIPDDDRAALETVVRELRDHVGHDFSLYKPSTIQRRVERRMGLHELASIDDYARYLHGSRGEAELLFRELLIGVTGFFRDPEVWEHVRDDAFPELLDSRGDRQTLRAWVPACSTGEEAYSLAIAFREAVGARADAAGVTLQVFATDLDDGAIERARQAVYPAGIAKDVSPARLDRWFVDHPTGYRVGSEIRDMVVFARQNVAMDPPFSRLDLVSCRNLLIYFKPELQRKLLRLFHYTLRPGGMLVLGTAETTGAQDDLFEAVHGSTRLYRALDGHDEDLPDFPTGWVASGRPNEGGPRRPRRSGERQADLQKLVTELVVRRFAPAAVLTTTEGDILYVSRKAGAYLEPSVGRANMNVFEMARDGLREPLHDAFQEAMHDAEPTVVVDIEVVDGDGARARRVDLVVEPLTGPDELDGLVLVVIDEPAPRPEAPDGSGGRAGDGGDGGRGVGRLEHALQQARERLQLYRQEMQAAQEELKSANEELQSTNEELQSTNEELGTSKEEMQSMNEELRTMNAELQDKVSALSQASDDMRNVLDSTDIAIIFLDTDLKVRRYTTQATSIFRLQEGDVGRPITDLTNDLDYPRMVDDAQAVLGGRASVQRDVRASGERWFQARLLPYRTEHGDVAGLVATFSDITAAKQLEAELRDTGGTDRRTGEAEGGTSTGGRSEGGDAS